MGTIAVLGTGMAGLGAGHALDNAGVPFVCYDKNPYYGGHTWSFRYDSGFVFDEGGHISFTKNERIRNLLAGNIAGKHEEPQLKIDNYWHGHRITHPVQCNMRGLPAKLIVDVIRDFVAVHETPMVATPNYAQWLQQTYGKTFAETFPMVYGRKYHTVAMDQLTTDWIGPRMYRPSLDEIVHGAVAGQLKHAHYVDTFRYPSHGGYLSYLEAFARRFELRLDHRVTGLDAKRRMLRFANGKEASYERVISSMPLPALIPLIDGVPKDVLEASHKLAFTTAVLINLGIDRADLSDTHITYFYDEDVVFSRVNLPHMFSPHNAPKGCGTIQAEVYFSDKYKPLRNKPESYIEPAIADLRRCGFIRDSDRILLKDAAINRYANVIYDHDRAPSVELVHGYLRDIGVVYCGRYGNWDHAWTDEAFLSGEAAAQQVLDEAGRRASGKYATG
ncbi:MAG TPA: FAD-dependent oxidoreductase [Stellaceae bacterium]